MNLSREIACSWRFSMFFGSATMLLACTSDPARPAPAQASGGATANGSDRGSGGSTALIASSGGQTSATTSATDVTAGGATTPGTSTVTTIAPASGGSSGTTLQTGSSIALGGASKTSATAAAHTGGASQLSSNTSAPSGGNAAGGTSNGGMSTKPTTSAGGTRPTSGATNGGATNGGATNGGATAKGGATGSSAPTVGGTGPFTLAWQDDFDTLDTGRWSAQNFSFDGNLATFTPSNVSVTNGVLAISLTANSGNTSKPYWGVELRSAQTMTYGKLSARMRFAKGSGVVSGLVLFYTPYPNCDWNEIDIEHLGNSSNSSQFNAMVYTGSVSTNCTTSVSPTQDPEVVDLGFNAETDFHQYDVEWTPASVRYIADGAVLRTWTKRTDLLKQPLTVLLTIWASSSSSWAGAVNTNTAPTSAEVDWIKVYSWNG